MLIDFSDKKLYNEIYIPLLKDNHRYIFLMWWAWSWKSFFVAQREIIKSFGKWNKLMVVRKVKDTHKDSTYWELTNIIKIWNLEQYFDITKSPLWIRNKLTGNDIIFRWMDDPEKIKSVSWVNRLWIEEATELSKEDFNQLDLRLRGLKQQQITLSFNPIDANHWLNTDFWTKQEQWREQTTFLKTTFLNNRFVWEKYKEVFERLKKQNPDYYKIYALWEWWTREGLVFEKQPKIINLPKEAKLLGYWLDFWFTNDPTSLVGIYEYNKWYILDEIIYRTGLTNQDLINIMKQEKVDRYSKIIADSAEPKSIEDIHRAGFNIHPSEKGKDSINNGIDFMKSLDIYLTKRSSNWIKEIQNYTWQKDKNWRPINKPVDYANHFIDAARYWLTWILKKPKWSVTFI